MRKKLKNKIWMIQLNNSNQKLRKKNQTKTKLSLKQSKPLKNNKKNRAERQTLLLKSKMQILKLQSNQNKNPLKVVLSKVLCQIFLKKRVIKVTPKFEVVIFNINIIPSFSSSFSWLFLVIQMDCS